MSEIRLHSCPFANLAQHTLLCAQVNSIQGMVPGLQKDILKLPHGAQDIGDSYALLRACERYPHAAEGLHAIHIREYLYKNYGYPSEPPGPKFQKWGQLLLPNRQIAQCSWKESQQSSQDVHQARCVKVCELILKLRGCLLRMAQITG